MMFSIERINAIFQKDFKDFSRNLSIFIIIFMPLLLAVFYSRMGIDSIESYYIVINLTFVMVATFVQCCLIAEEKEKDTLRGLMLSPASTIEILGGKGLLSFLLTIIIVLFSAFLLGYKPENIVVVAIAIILSAFFYIGMGTLLGLLARSVMEASLIVLPVMGVFSFGSLLTGFIDRYPMLKVVEYFPNVQLIELAKKVEGNAGLVDVLSNYGIILVWVVIIGALTIAVYQRKMVD